MHLQMTSAKWRPFCLGLNELTRLMGMVGREDGQTDRSTDADDDDTPSTKGPRVKIAYFYKDIAMPF